MLRNIVISGLRNILRNKSFSIINLLGLSVSMTLGLLIIIVLREQHSFDNFHHDSDRIFRVNTRAIRVDGGNESYASAPMPLGRTIKDEYAFAENVVCINRNLRVDVIAGNVTVPINGLFADPSILDVFNFQLEKGNAATALSEPNGLVLSSEGAEKIFGKGDPMGQSVTLDGFGEFIVAGVLEKFPGRTHFDFEVLVSTSKLVSLESNGVVGRSLDNWNNYYSGYVYIKLKPGQDTDRVEEALATIAEQKYKHLRLEPRDKGYEFYLNALSDITPSPELSNQMGTGMPGLLLIFLGGLAGIVLIMACFNYTNLMLAKSLSRSREIGVRKVAGARRWQVFAQFVGESIVFSFIALIFSYLLLQFLKPAFSELYFAKKFPSTLVEDGVVYACFVAFATLIGLLAGALPAMYLSAFRATAVLKDYANLRVFSRFTFRKLLIAAQFALSVIFVLIILVVYSQVSFMVRQDYSFKEEGIYNVYLNGMKFERLANEVRKLPGLVSVGGVSHALGTYADQYTNYIRELGEEPFRMRDFIVDDNYINNLGLTFLAGKNFDPAVEGGHERHLILNERALQEFGLTDPLSAVGQVVYGGDSTLLTIIGVVKNFNFRPLNYEIGPLALRYNQSRIAILSASVLPGHEQQVTSAIETIWKKLDPVHPFRGVWMREQIDDAYWNGGFLDIIKVVAYISVIAITLACMGILGMSMYATQTRVKEIGVRKVMGASTKQITILLSRSFLLLIAIGVAVGLPIGYLLGEVFVEDYAYRIEITPLHVLLGVSLVSVLGLVAIGSQTWKVAADNPVKSLRYE